MQLREYQEEGVDSVFQYFYSGKTGNPVLAMPTGTGKSLVIAGLIHRIMQQWPYQRFMVLTHVKELVEQNALKLSQYWPNAPLGVYSAGLRSRDTAMPVIFGGIGSVNKKEGMFGPRDLIIVDECHLLSPKSDTMYQRTFDAFREMNPHVKLIGLSATPFRLGQGMITDGGLFTDICCDMTGVEAFNRFIAQGYLAPLVPRPTTTEIDISGVSVGSDGDYAKGELQAAVNKDEITYKALTEMCDKAHDRAAWLIFAAGNEHADRVAEMLQSFGIEAASVHSGMSSRERDDRIRDYKAGILRCLVNNNVLTTGFDHPPVDFIGMLRHTMSPGLWVQMLGRGTRPSPDTGKRDCLVLDFARNTPRLGPINDPLIPKKKGKGGGEAPVRICECCGTYNHASARSCTFCGEEFTFAPKIVTTSGDAELIRSDLPIIETFEVHQVHYYLHEKAGSRPSIRVSYFCGSHKFDEWVCLEHSGFAGKKARDWWRRRFPGDYVPDTTSEALSIINQLRVPSRIKVWINKHHPEITSYDY